MEYVENIVSRIFGQEIGPIEKLLSERKELLLWTSSLRRLS
jgi:hypothetical protein